MKIQIVTECYLADEHPILTPTVYTNYYQAQDIFTKSIRNFNKDITDDKLFKCVMEQVFNCEEATITIEEQTI